MPNSTATARKLVHGASADGSVADASRPLARYYADMIRDLYEYGWIIVPTRIVGWNLVRMLRFMGDERPYTVEEISNGYVKVREGQEGDS